MKNLVRVVISALLLSGIALSTQACGEQAEDDPETTLVVNFLREALPHLDRDGFELSFATMSNDDGVSEAVVTCNSSSSEQNYCGDFFAEACEDVGGGGSSEPGGGESCSVPTG